MNDKYREELDLWANAVIDAAHDDVTPVLARARQNLSDVHEMLDEAYCDLCHMNAPVEMLNRFNELIGLVDEAQVDCKCMADDVDGYVIDQEERDYENV